jgi:hypothetical protein
MAQATKQLQNQTKTQGPKDDDELHHWIRQNLGMNIPRIAVCDGHQSPFEFISDIYFERVTAAIAMASRGGSKTMSSAIIHLLNSLYKPRCQSISVGAQLAQADRVYENLKILLKIHGKVDTVDKHPMISRSIQQITQFINDAKVEILPGTISAVNGPHAPKVHTDEVDIMDYGVYLQSRNISQSLSYFVDGPNGQQIEMTIVAQDWITSTRKSSSGLMQRLINDIEESERQGYKPPYKLYTWCFVESAKPVSNCQVAFPNIPKAMHCECDRIVNDKWDDGTPRLFVDICNGRLAKPDGFTPLGDIHKRFEMNDRNTWEAEQECSKPETGGMVFKAFDRQRMAIKWWEPRPEFGMIVQGVDFSGGTNPAAVEWVQVLNRDVRWWGADQTKTDHPNRIIKAGTKIVFDEIYKAEVGNMEIASMVIDREKAWRKIHPEFEVSYRFVDPSNQDNRRDWHAIGLKTQFFCTRSIPEQCRTVNDLIKEDLLLFDSTRCIMLPLEMNAYHYPDNRAGMEYDKETPVDDYNHTVSAIRYTIENLKVIDRKGLSKAGLPMSGGSHYINKSPIKHSAPRYLPSSMLKGP